MKFAFIGVAAVFAVATASPALAQAVISDPGYCAQFYPNANCQNLGAGNPYTDGGYWGNDFQESRQATMGEAPLRHRTRHHG